MTDDWSHWSSGLHTNAFNVSITSHEFSNGVGTITFDGEVTTIGFRAFYECDGLTSVSIPNSVTTIGERAFYGCSGLTSVTIPNSVTTIESSAFYHCSCLTSVIIPSSITTIGSLTFYDCISLTSITIPSSVIMIGHDAFLNCKAMTSIDVDAANTHYASIDGVLFNYAKDTLIKYPGGNSRKNYTIPNSVTTIGNAAFHLCSNLTFVTIPSSAIAIGEYDFYGCSGLTSITCEATKPPTCGYNCFDDVDKSIPLYVPAGSIEAYKNADVWKDFTNIRLISTAIENVDANINIDVNTTKFLHNGQVIIRQGDKTYDIVGREM